LRTHHALVLTTTHERLAESRRGGAALCRADYDAAALAGWAERVLLQPWDEAFVFFKHEDEGLGPALAE
jgi:hypothetical protein